MAKFDTYDDDGNNNWQQPVDLPTFSYNFDEPARSEDQTQAPAPAAAPTPQYFQPAAGFDTARLNDANDHEIKYEYGRYAQTNPNLNGQALRDAFSNDASVRSLFPGLQTQGADLLRANGNDPWQDVVGDVGGQNRLQFMNANGSGPGFAGLQQGGARGAGGAGGAGGRVPPGGAYQSTNPFDDPATKNYIDLLNSRIQSLLQPQSNPEMDQLLQYMQQYFQQLQQPAYSDQQRDLISTQALDPMERQRQARKQQVIQQMAARGMGPGDGPTIQALQMVDREFDQMRTGAQGKFATDEIALGQRNQSQAVDVGSAAAALRNGMFQQQDARANTALGYAKQIPDMASQRLQSGVSLLNGSQLNPASLMGAMNGANELGMRQSGQDSAYWQSVMAAMAQAFGL